MFSNHSEQVDLQIDDFACPPPALLTCPPNKLRQDIFVVFTFAFRFARMRFDTLRRIDGTRHQNIGTQVVKTFPLIRGHFTQIIERGFGGTETASIGLRFFAVAFANKNHRSVFGLLQQWEQRTGQTHRCHGINTVLVDPF